MKKIFLFILISLISVSFGLLFWADISDFYTKFFLELPQAEKGIDSLIRKAERQVFTPPPLKATEETLKAYLTKEGVIQWTNAQRAKYGLSPLRENARLNVSAAVKAEDMFEKQYFAHESPSGLGVKDLADDVAYDFILIGENLALGNFEDDQTLVQAWMDSPGHRANILNANYQEIGASVIKGVFEGKTTWISVQHFGKPVSACPQPSGGLKNKIEENQSQISVLQSDLEALKTELQATKPRQRESYNRIIEEYNNLVSQYNLLVSETKDLVYQYNMQIAAFNECVSN
jgi:uncharacterized protein YkwD